MGLCYKEEAWLYTDRGSDRGGQDQGVCGGYGESEEQQRVRGVRRFGWMESRSW